MLGVCDWPPEPTGDVAASFGAGSLERLCWLCYFFLYFLCLDATAVETAGQMGILSATAKKRNRN